MGRKKKDRDPFDWFEEWGFGDIFEEFDERFRKLQRRLNQMIREALESPETYGKPMIYGWSVRIGPDGKPEIREFGNVKPSIREETVREPLVDVIEGDNKISVTAEVPGVSKDDIDLEITEKTLTIKVDTKDRKYYKEIELPSEVIPDTAKATYQNGVLDVEIKKVKPKKGGKKVKIE